MSTKLKAQSFAARVAVATAALALPILAVAAVLPGFTQEASATVDGPPVVSEFSPPTLESELSGTDWTWTLIFSEPVSGVTADDISGSVPLTVGSVTQTDLNTYRVVTVLDAATSGPVSLILAQGSGEDQEGLGTDVLFSSSLAVRPTPATTNTTIAPSADSGATTTFDLSAFESVATTEGESAGVTLPAAPLDTTDTSNNGIIDASPETLPADSSLADAQPSDDTLQQSPATIEDQAPTTFEVTEQRSLDPEASEAQVEEAPAVTTPPVQPPAATSSTPWGTIIGGLLLTTLLLAGAYFIPRILQRKKLYDAAEAKLAAEEAGDDRVDRELEAQFAAPAEPVEPTEPTPSLTSFDSLPVVGGPVGVAEIPELPDLPLAEELPVVEMPELPDLPVAEELPVVEMPELPDLPVIVQHASAQPPRVAQRGAESSELEGWNASEDLTPPMPPAELATKPLSIVDKMQTSPETMARFIEMLPSDIKSELEASGYLRRLDGEVFLTEEGAQHLSRLI